MINWYYLLVVACAFVLFLFYKEWTRKKRTWLYARLITSLLAVSGLLFMAWPYARHDKTGAVNKLVLLTEGFIKDSADNFLKNNAGIPVFSDKPANFFAPDGHTAKLVTDWTLFANKYKEDTFHVFGNGCSNEILSLLSPHPIVFHANPALSAINNIYWKQNIETGEPLEVQGSYENLSGKEMKIILRAFGADRDSVFIAPGISADFTLHTIPVHTGQAVYSLLVAAGKDTLQNEPVPVNVQTASPLQLLIISSSPDFENTYLKNHLSLKGYPFAVTTTISSSKTDRQFLNMPLPQEASPLTVPYLSKFDVLIADKASLQKASTAELAAIRAVVQEQGTGLILKIDMQQNTTAFYSRFFPVKTLRQNKQSFHMLRGTATDSNRYKIKITDPVTIGYQPGTQIILQDEQSNVYAAGIIYGTGKIIATTLQNTYSMALAGDKSAYRQLWGLLLNKAAKKIYAEESWQAGSFISFVNEPVQLQAEKNEVFVTQALIGKTPVHLKQNAFLPFQWKGVYWPVKSGWQPLPQLNKQTGDWYVYKRGDWKQLTYHHRLSETKKYASLHPVLSAQPSHYPQSSFSGKGKLFLLFLFLICCIFLWVEQKTG